MKKNKFKLYSLKNIVILVTALFLFFGLGSYCFAVGEQANVSIYRPGGNDEATWWFKPTGTNSPFSEFFATINGQRAMCLQSGRVAAPDTLTYVGNLDMDAASLMYYIQHHELWETSTWKAGLDNTGILRYNVVVEQMAFWHEVEEFNYNNISLNEGWDASGDWYHTRMSQVQQAVWELLNTSRNYQNDFIIENNMSITVDSSNATPTTNSDGTSFVGPYRVNAEHLEGQLNISKKSGDTAVIVDVNGNPISSVTNGGEVYVRFSSGDTTTAEFEVAGMTKTKITCKKWQNPNNNHQDFATLDTELFQEKEPFTSSPPESDDEAFKRKVYVRHIDSVTHELIPEFANSRQKEYLNDNPGTTNDVLSKNLDDSYFLEKYEYDSTSTMNIVKSSKTQTTAGKKYKYLGGKKAVDDILSTAKTRLITSTDDWDENTVNVKTDKVSADTEDVTVIEFKYEPIPPDIIIIEQDVQPTVHTYYGPSPSGITTYIPSDETIKPYLITPKFIYKSISYELKSYIVMEDHGEMGDVPHSSEYEDEDGNTQTNEWTEYEWIPNIVPVEYWHYVLSEFKVYRVTGARYGNDNGTGSGRHFSNKIIGSNNEDLIAGSVSDYELGIVGIDSELQGLYNQYAVPRQVENFQSKLENDIKNDFSETKKTNMNNFSSTFNVPKFRYNGLRRATGYIKYNMFDPMSGSGGEKKYSTVNENYVNVYTPVNLAEPTVTSDNIVDHSEGNSNNIIQKNGDFILRIPPPINAPLYSGLSSSRFVDHYYVIFDMDILLTSSSTIREGNNDVTKSAGYTVRKNTPIRIGKNGDNVSTFTAKATSSENAVGNQGDIVNQLQNKITVVGVTHNMPENSLESNVLNLNNNTYINDSHNNWQSPGVNTNTHSSFGTSLTYKNMFQDAYYFAKRTIVTSNIGRIYDFKITDCTDVSFKDVFRKSSNSNSVNDLTGNVYYSGIRALKIYTNEVNILEDREASNIYTNNNTISKIIPLGPYKHVAGSYVQAPKMGYKISFDLKTSGFYDLSSSKKVEITPSYYYISKNGDNFLDSSEIILYYKDSSGKYKKFGSTPYNIAFKPNDGYRSVYNNGTTPNLSAMSQKLENLDVSKMFTLNNNMMSFSDNSFIQAWYGEFKLPNSTIAVKKSGGSINNPLKDGYIGVRFDMDCVTKDNSTNKEIRVTYNQNDKKSIKSNTTQWDYEGYLGIKYGENIGNSNNATIKFEKQNLIINTQALYDKIRGTVVFFDLDNRAANDFD